MDISHAEGANSDQVRQADACPEGHEVGATAVFCPVCLALVRAAPGLIWKPNGS